MTQSEATELLNQRLKTEWVAAHATVPYALNNETYRGNGQRPFAVFIVAGVTPEQRSMGPEGTRRFEYKATFVAQLFGELDKGTSELDALVDSVRTIFQSKHLGTAGDPMWTKAAQASNPIQKDGLNMVVVQVPLTWFNLE